MTKIALVIDDEPANIDLIKGLLPQCFKCKAALNGIVGLKQIAKALPDIVFLDLVMPGITGVETLAKIRQNPSTQALPVIIVSGKKSEAELVELESLGIQGYLIKPINPDVFFELVETIFGGRN